jgi:adenosylcobinamide-GDP ribazoletransferase
LTAFVLLFSVFITGALHIDGLADTFDGFGGGKTAEKTLEIMKDPRQGTFGVAAIVFDLLLKWLLMKPIIETENYTLLLMLFIISRSVQPLLLSFFPYARKGGGTAAPFCESGKVYSLLSVAAALIISGYLLKLNGIFAMLVAIIIVLLWGLYCRKRIGGITGDCIGAGNEFTEIALLILFNWIYINAV